MQLIPDLFSHEITHVINDHDEQAGTVQTVSGGFQAAQNGRVKAFKTMKDALLWLTTGKEPKQEKPKQSSQLNLF